jgi:hypothetical protein
MGGVPGSKSKTRVVAMRNLLLMLLLALSVPGLALAQESGSGSFERVKAKTFEKKKFMFPEDVSGSKLNIMFLSMGADRESGEAQQLALIDWHLALVDRGIFSDEVMPYHFPVLSGVPFFVKGMIAGEMKETYEGKVPLNQAGILFIKDLPSFAESAGLALDDQPTIVIATSDAKPLQSFKGEVSPEGVDEIVAAVEQLK